MKPISLRLRQLVAAFSLFISLGLALAWPALRYPMSFDDLHLIRSFLAQDIRDSFSHNWDQSAIETPGLRPFTILFNHMRYQLFGEDVVRQRLFLIGLYGFYLTLCCWIAWMLGSHWHMAVVAAALSLVAKYSIYHYIWIADGIHLMQGLCFVVSIWLLFRFLQYGGYAFFVGSLLTAFAGVLTREDTLAAIPVIVLLGFAYSIKGGLETAVQASGGDLAGLLSQPRSAAGELIYASVLPGFPTLMTSLRRVAGHSAAIIQAQRLRMFQLVAYTIILFSACAAFLVYRAQNVPQAQSPEMNVMSMLRHVMFSFHYMGMQYFDGFSRVLVDGWSVILALGVLVAVVFRLVTPRVLLWLICAIITSAPGLNVERVNLLFFPVTFAALCCCEVFWKLSSMSWIGRGAVAITLVWAFTGSFYMSRVYAESFHPTSTEVVKWNAELIYGSHAARAPIPPARRIQTKHQLAAVGIFSAEDLKRRLPQMVEHALQEGRRTPSSDGQVFVPRLQIFER